MAQCLSESKPFSPSPLHFYGIPYRAKISSCDSVNPSLGHVPMFSQSYHDLREASLKQGSPIRGYGAFGMPGVYKTNQEMYYANNGLEKFKSSVGEKSSVASGSKHYLNGGSTIGRAPYLEPNCAPEVRSSQTFNKQAHGGHSLKETNVSSSKSLREGDAKFRIPVSQTGKFFSKGGSSINIVPNSISSLQYTSSSKSCLDRSQFHNCLQPGNNKAVDTKSGNGSIKRSAIPWNGPEHHLELEGNPCFEHSAKLVTGNNSRASDIQKPSQSSRGDLARDRTLGERSACISAVVVNSGSGDAAQITAARAEGKAVAATSKAGNGNVPADKGTTACTVLVGEGSRPMGHRRELVSQPTPSQSWPNSPNNLKAVHRTRNLSEGCFNLIFPVNDVDKSICGTRPNMGSPNRSSSKFSSESTGSISSDASPTRKAYSPLSALATVSHALSDPDSSHVLGATGFGSPAKDVLGRSSRNSETLSCLQQSTNKAETSTALACVKDTCEELQATSQSATYCGKSVTSIADSKSRSSPDKYTAQSTCVLHDVLATSHLQDKRFAHGIVTGGSFERKLPSFQKISSPVAVISETTVSSTFGESTKGSHHRTTSMIITSSFGNIIKDNSNPDLKKHNLEGTNGFLKEGGFLLKRALSSMDPEEVKNLGNDQYKKGHFSEALLMYERAITLMPGQALFHSNRAAALAAVGRLGDAVQDCKEAIKLDPLYGWAHQRLASLLLRLGRIEDARLHFKARGVESDPRDMQRCDIISRHVTKCLEARKASDWADVIRQSDAAVVAGADSATKMFAFKAEALFHLGQLDEAIRVISAAEQVENALNSDKKFAESIVQTVAAKIDMALGKFVEATAAAEKAVDIDCKNPEAIAILQKARAIGRSRTLGNELYKAGKFFDASAAYGEGLEYDPANAILLCNRAACRSNLGLWECAIEDCNAALAAQPNYIKAHLRRAHCFAKLEHWEEALADYEILRMKLPGDIEVARAFSDTQSALRKSQSEESHKKSFGEGLGKTSSFNLLRAPITKR